jgi:hypothetical protein
MLFTLLRLKWFNELLWHLVPAEFRLLSYLIFTTVIYDRNLLVIMSNDEVKILIAERSRGRVQLRRGVHHREADPHAATGGAGLDRRRPGGNLIKLFLSRRH